MFMQLDWEIIKLRAKVSPVFFGVPEGSPLYTQACECHFLFHVTFSVLSPVQFVGGDCLRDPWGRGDSTLCSPFSCT